MQYKVAAIYTRVSTNAQDERGSKETQKILIQEFALKNNYSIIAEFSDTDHGDKADRVGITALKEYLRVNSSVKYVLVSHSDRFTSRNERFILFRRFGSKAHIYKRRRNTS